MKGRMLGGRDTEKGAKENDGKDGICLRFSVGFLVGSVGGILDVYL